jgi:hypothetical protein
MANPVCTEEQTEGRCIGRPATDRFPDRHLCAGNFVCHIRDAAKIVPSPGSRCMFAGPSTLKGSRSEHGIGTKCAVLAAMSAVRVRGMRLPSALGGG